MIHAAQVKYSNGTINLSARGSSLDVYRRQILTSIHGPKYLNIYDGRRPHIGIQMKRKELELRHSG